MKKALMYFIVGLGAFLLAVLAPEDFKSNKLEMNYEIWKSKNVRLRGQMVSSLLSQEEKLIGKSTSEIKELLGQPELEEPNSLHDQVRYGFLSENINPARNYLVVEFSADTQQSIGLALADG